MNQKKKEQIKHKSNRRKEIIKVSQRMKQRTEEKQIFNKTKSWFFEKINKIYKEKKKADSNYKIQK